MTRLPASAEATATMTRLPDTPGRSAPTTHAPAPDPSRTTPPAPASPGRAPGAPAPRPGAGLPLVPPPGPAAPAPASRSAGAAPAAAAPEEWVVELGDSLWTIAEETMADARAGAAPSEADVTAYWRRLVEANRDRLAAPANPDLLLPGQRLVLPTVS